MAETPPQTDVPVEHAPIPGLPPDWPQQATGKVVTIVDNVRAKTAGPAIRVGRGIVYGLVAVTLLFVALPLLLIGATRGLISLIDLAAGHDKAVWLSYLAIGGFFTLIGLALWSRRPRGAARG